jgi:integrase
MAHVEKRAQGRWRARYRAPDGRERSRTFDRKVDAERWLATVEADKVRGEWVNPARQRTTIAEWAERWEAGIVHLEPSTVAWYRAKLSNHVLPVFGGVPAGSIDTLAVKRWVAEMRAAGKGARTIQGAVVTLSQVLGAAVDGGALRANPARGVSVPRVAKREMLFLEAAEVEGLAQAIRAPYGTLVRFAAYSGLRAGEIGGLRVGRLNLLQRRVEVTEALKEVNGRLYFGGTKTHERRAVHIPRQLCDELGAYLGDRPHRPTDLVFTAPDGGPLRHNLFYRRSYKPAVAAAGLPDALRFHDLRHTCAALLIGQGHQQYEIMRHLGHSSISVTVDTYAHLFPSRAEAVADTLEQVWAAAR